MEHEYWCRGPGPLSCMCGIPEGGRMVDAYARDKWRGGGFHQAYARLHRDGISNTITASLYNPDPDRPIHCRDTRAISASEAARLQIFDDGYLLVGMKAQKRMQVGNAVQPLLARSVACLRGRNLEADRTGCRTASLAAGSGMCLLKWC